MGILIEGICEEGGEGSRNQACAYYRHFYEFFNLILCAHHHVPLRIETVKSSSLKEEKKL